MEVPGKEKVKALKENIMQELTMQNPTYEHFTCAWDADANNAQNQEDKLKRLLERNLSHNNIYYLFYDLVHGGDYAQLKDKIWTFLDYYECTAIRAPGLGSRCEEDISTIRVIKEELNEYEKDPKYKLWIRGISGIRLY
jgi:hypothetical protein